MGQIVAVQSESVGNIYAGYRFSNMLTDIIDSMAYMVGVIFALFDGVHGVCEFCDHIDLDCFELLF